MKKTENEAPPRNPTQKSSGDLELKVRRRDGSQLTADELAGKLRVRRVTQIVQALEAGKKKRVCGPVMQTDKDKISRIDMIM